MRCYLGLTAEDIEKFLQSSSLTVAEVFGPTLTFLQDYLGEEEEQEEIEFELSLKAAEYSRSLTGSTGKFGFVLALEIQPRYLGEESGFMIEVKSSLAWSQVEALLVSESSEPELSWFAPQEISTYLPLWLSEGALVRGLPDGPA